MAIIEYNTGGKQAAMASTTSVCQIAQQNGVAAPEKRLQAAVENDDVVVWRNRVVRAVEPDLRAAIAEEDQREEPNRTKVERLATALREVRDA